MKHIPCMHLKFTNSCPNMPTACLKNISIYPKSAEIQPIIRIILKEGIKEFSTSPEMLEAGNRKRMTEALSLMKVPEKNLNNFTGYILLNITSRSLITRLTHDFKSVLWSTFKAITLKLLKVMVIITSLKEVS